MPVIGGFRPDLSRKRMTDGNFENVSAGVLFPKVAHVSTKTVVSANGKHLMHFQSETSVFKSLRSSVDEARDRSLTKSSFYLLNYYCFYKYFNLPVNL